ncbi:MAG: nuclear transport factor 2 family protein [Steroidobacteraceae bacterium]
MKKLPLLETELARLEGAGAVKRLQRAFGYYLDAAQWDEAADLFASDATLEMGLDGVYCGQARIRQYLHALGEGRTGLQEGEIHEWVQLQPVVHVAPDARSAKARWRAFVIGGRLADNAFWGEGPYEVEYVRHDGVWKIAKLHWYQTVVVPYEGGWVKNRDANGGIWASRRLPPDRPPSERYDTWPGVYTPAFHYERPATALPEVLAAPLASAGASAVAPAAAPAADALAHRFNALAGRLRRLRAIAEIENLVSAYGYYLDKQRWDAFTDLFTDDATMEISQRGIYVGRASIRRALELFGPQGLEPNHLHNHQQMQPVVHVSADCKRAWVRSRAFGQLGVHQGAGIWHGGLYENELVEVDGVWKFKTDHVYTTYFAHYEQGWMTGPRPTPKASEKIPPDLPPSVVYESFPEIFIPPFHYPHPVTGEPIDTGASGAAAMAADAGATAAAEPLDASRLPAELRPGADRLAAIERSVQRLEDEQAIETLQRTYGYLVDKALWRQAADLFASDGTLEIGGRGVFAGRKRVLDYLTWLAPQGLTRGRLFDHLQLQPIVTVSPDGRSARGRWRFFTQVGEYQKSALWGLGTYENEYVKRDGLWQIATLHSYFRMYTPYADGWAKTAVPNTRPEKDLPPDRPPTVVYDQYPSPFIPPCHYGNPVTGLVSGARAATGSDRG